MMPIGSFMFFILYMWPTIKATRYIGQKRYLRVLFTNTLFGWTVVGWFKANRMANGGE